MSKLRWRRLQMSWLFALIAFAFLLGPFVVVIGASFDSRPSYFAHFPPQDFSFTWYRQIPQAYFNALWTSSLVAGTVAVLSTFIGMAAAFGIVRGRLIGKQFLLAFFRLPIQIPLVVTGAVFMQFYYQLTAVLGVKLLYSFSGLVLAHLFVAIPYSVGAIAAILARFDDTLEEAAYSLGATGWSAFKRVIFPAIRPGVVIGMFYGFIVSFGDVPISVFLVDNATMTIPVRLFYDMQFDFHPTILAISTVILVLSFALIIGVQKIVGLEMVIPSKNR